MRVLLHDVAAAAELILVDVAVSETRRENLQGADHGPRGPVVAAPASSRAIVTIVTLRTVTTLAVARTPATGNVVALSDVTVSQALRAGAHPQHGSE